MDTPNRMAADTRIIVGIGSGMGRGMGAEEKMATYFPK